MWVHTAMLNTKLLAPMVNLVATCKRLATIRAAVGKGVFITSDVARLPFMRIETGIIDRLLANCAAKMLRMPRCVKGSEVAAANGVRTRF